MSTEKPIHDRKFNRISLSDESKPATLQVNGVAAKLFSDSFFEFSICNAVLKDVSLGGAGALVPIDKRIPNRVKVMVADKIRLVANVVNRKQVGEKLVFLGLDWTHESEEKCRHMLRLINQLAHHENEHGPSKEHKGEKRQ